MPNPDIPDSNPNPSPSPSPNPNSKQQKCHYHHGEWKGTDYCKVGYPRPLFNRSTCEKGETPWKQPGGADFLDPNPHPELEPADFYLEPETERYIYRTDVEEDQRLSTYVPLMLLAWGANMNVQYCTTSGFLSYIAKCSFRHSPTALTRHHTPHARPPDASPPSRTADVTKPEPSALLPDSEALRLREKQEGASAAVRFLTGRVIGAFPEPSPYLS